MSGAPLLDEHEIHAAIHAGLGALEKQLKALRERTTVRLKPAERRYVRAVADNVARRIVVWQELSRDETDLARRLEAISEQVRELQSAR